MKKIDSVCLLIQNKIRMLRKYKPYGADVAVDELQDLLSVISSCEYTEERYEYIDVLDKE